MKAKISGAVGLSWLLCLSLLPAFPAISMSAKPPLSAEAQIDLEGERRPVNRMVLGNNVQWVDRGDELLERSGGEFSSEMVEKVRKMGPTILRYPGGSLSDLYRWKAGIGPKEQRGISGHFHAKNTQKIEFGTDEFLELCRKTGAEPLITVNVITGTPEEAAEWVKYVNAPGKSPRVKYWEIGNEPYLKDDRPELAISPEDFARRAAECIRAMKKADPDIVVGVPLRSDKIGGFPLTPFPGYNRKLLGTIGEEFDFAAVHNAYLPMLWDVTKSPSSEEIYLATMAGVCTVENDMVETRRVLKERFPKRDVQIAITEYAPMFSLGGKPTDNYISSLAGALLVADCLRLFAGMDDMIFANHWSLSGNWVFGAISQSGELRPVYHVLEKFGTLLQGERVEIKVESPTIRTPTVGIVPGQAALPAITGFATVDGDTVRVLLMNKHPTEHASVFMSFKGGQSVLSANGQELWCADYFEKIEGDGLQWKNCQPEARGSGIAAEMKPHSLQYLELKVGPRATIASIPKTPSPPVAVAQSHERRGAWMLVVAGALVVLGLGIAWRRGG